jgi:hypothetical protein
VAALRSTVSAVSAVSAMSKFASSTSASTAISATSRTSPRSTGWSSVVATSPSPRSRSQGGVVGQVIIEPQAGVDIDVVGIGGQELYIDDVCHEW